MTKMRKHLKEVRDKHHAQCKPTTDWVWVNDNWRPIVSYRTVKKGKRKGDVEVTLSDDSKRVVPVKNLRLADRDSGINTHGL